MNKKAVPYIIVFTLVIVLFFIRKCQNNEDTVQTKTSKSTPKSRNRGFDRNTTFIEFTKHAMCRMDCRKISKADINDIMKKGQINYKKSQVKQQPCPIYAVQGYTNDNEHLRVIFAQCDNTTKVITCYNLEEDYDCACPGDEKKYK